MKFKICGELDCPDWLLNEIENLSKMSAVKMILLGYEVIKKLKNSEMNVEQVKHFCRNIKNQSDVKGIIAALSFILRNAAKFDVKPDNVSQELQQLGLPRTHSRGIARIVGKEKESLQQFLLQTSFRLSRVKSLEWRIDFVIGTNLIEDVNTPTVEMKLNLESPNKSNEILSFGLNYEKFRVLLGELKRAKNLMDMLVKPSTV